MIAVIRIKGIVGIRKEIAETLDRLRLRRKYACVVFEKPSEVQLGMIKKVQDFVAFGEISDDVYKKLIEARGKKDSEGKLKPFFRLHPPRGGAKTQRHYGIEKGILGNNKKDINKLIGRML